MSDDSALIMPFTGLAVRPERCGVRGWQEVENFRRVHREQQQDAIRSSMLLTLGSPALERVDKSDIADYVKKHYDIDAKDALIYTYPNTAGIFGRKPAPDEEISWAHAKCEEDQTLDNFIAMVAGVFEVEHAYISLYVDAHLMTVTPKHMDDIRKAGEKLSDVYRDYLGYPEDEAGDQVEALMRRMDRPLEQYKFSLKQSNARGS